MPTYDEGITRDVSGDPLVPAPVAAEIIKELPQSSAVLNLARKVPMSTKTNKMPVLSVMPTAYWVDGDVGLKQSTRADWGGVTLTAEELAVLVPIPDSYIDDSQIPIWEEVRPLLVEAIGAAFDAAALFGTDAPSSFPDGVYLHALAAGNQVVVDHGDTDLAENVAEVAELVAADGFNVNGFASRPGLKWRLARLRSAEGIPIYQPNLQDSVGGNLYGFPLREVGTDAWDTSEAELILGDWRKAIAGVRKDITFTKHTDGVISDGDGVVVYNAMQQDSTIYRAVFRGAFALANPATRTGSGTKSPFGVVQATSANS